MKIRDLFIYLFTYILLIGVYFKITAAVALSYVVIILAFLLYLFLIWGIGKLDNTAIFKARSEVK